MYRMGNDDVPIEKVIISFATGFGEYQTPMARRGIHLSKSHWDLQRADRIGRTHVQRQEGVF